MSGRARGLWAAGFATAALAGIATFWLAAGPVETVMKLSGFSDLAVFVVLLVAVGTGVNLAVIFMLATPALIKSWATRLPTLAMVSALGLLSLFFFYGPYALMALSAILWSHLGVIDLFFIGMAAVMFVSVPVSLGFTLAATSRGQAPSNSRPGARHQRLSG